MELTSKQEDLILDKEWYNSDAVLTDEEIADLNISKILKELKGDEVREK